MKNNAEKYFHQKDLSILEIILLMIAIISLIVATFIQDGGPVGFPILLICIVVFFIHHSFKIKDNEMEQILKKIIQDNKVKDSESTIKCYELKNTAVKKRRKIYFSKLFYYRYYIFCRIYSFQYLYY